MSLLERYERREALALPPAFQELQGHDQTQRVNTIGLAQLQKLDQTNLGRFVVRHLIALNIGEALGATLLTSTLLPSDVQDAFNQDTVFTNCLGGMIGMHLVSEAFDIKNDESLLRFYPDEILDNYAIKTTVSMATIEAFKSLGMMPKSSLAEFSLAGIAFNYLLVQNIVKVLIRYGRGKLLDNILSQSVSSAPALRAHLQKIIDPYKQYIRGVLSEQQIQEAFESDRYDGLIDQAQDRILRSFLEFQELLENNPDLKERIQIYQSMLQSDTRLGKSQEAKKLREEISLAFQLAYPSYPLMNKAVMSVIQSSVRIDRFAIDLFKKLENLEKEALLGLSITNSKQKIFFSEIVRLNAQLFSQYHLSKLQESLNDRSKVLPRLQSGHLSREEMKRVYKAIVDAIYAYYRNHPQTPAVFKPALRFLHYTFAEEVNNARLKEGTLRL